MHARRNQTIGYCTLNKFVTLCINWCLYLHWYSCASTSNHKMPMCGLSVYCRGVCLHSNINSLVSYYGYYSNGSICAFYMPFAADAHLYITIGTVYVCMFAYRQAECDVHLKM